MRSEYQVVCTLDEKIIVQGSYDYCNGYLTCLISITSPMFAGYYKIEEIK